MTNRQFAKEFIASAFSALTILIVAAAGLITILATGTPWPFVVLLLGGSTYLFWREVDTACRVLRVWATNA